MLTSTNPRSIYLHCWNGLHASGEASALVLRQFSGVSSLRAVKYRDDNTNGHNDADYDPIKARVRAFKPRSEFAISASTKALVCSQL